MPARSGRIKVWRWLAMTGLVVCLCGFMTLKGVIQYTEYYGDQPWFEWWAAIRYGLAPWVWWIVLAPGIAALAIRFRVGAGAAWWHALVHVVVGALIGWLLFYAPPLLPRHESTPAAPIQAASVHNPDDSRTPVDKTRSSAISPEPNDGRADEMIPAMPLQPIRPALTRPAVATLLSKWVNYVVFIAIINALLHSRELLTRRADESRLHEALARAELLALRGQIRPHFLFNTMNSIKTLMARDVDAAGEMLTRLAELLRASFSDLGDEVSLRQEVELARSYLGIEQVRAGDRLRTKWEIEPGLDDARLPALCLQPLVENAIKHGIDRMTGPGEVRVVVGAKGGVLLLVVENDRPADSGSVHGTGIGLANIRERIERLYNGEGRVDVDDSVAGRFRVAVSVPLRREDRPDSSDQTDG